MKNILVTGKSGIGKTTLVKKLSKQLPENVCQGFYTEEIRENGRRVGFKIATFSGEEKVMAHINYKSHHRAGKYFVNIDSINDTLDCIANENVSKSKIFLVDEIGKMESFSEKFRTWLESALNEPIPLVATIALGGNRWINSIKDDPNTEIFTLSMENRDSLFEKLNQIITDQIELHPK